MYYFYIFKCRDGSLYSGITTDLLKREKMHNAGKGATYTRTHGGGNIIYNEQYFSKGEALKREVQVKKWSREKKLELVGFKKMKQ